LGGGSLNSANRKTNTDEAKPAEKLFKLTDGHSLYLLVKPNGGCYWRIDYSTGGKRKLLAFGVYPEVSLKEARDKQAGACKLIRSGIDPMEASMSKSVHSRRSPRTPSRASRENDTSRMRDAGYTIMPLSYWDLLSVRHSLPWA
jgi:hypothetical protein